MSSVQKIWIGTAVVLVSIGSYGARAQQASPQTAQPSEKRATQPSEKQAMQSSEKQMAQPSEKMFLTKAAMGGEAEVALATLAQRKAADPKVKALAERIEADHKKANSELRAIIAAKNITVPGGPDKEHQAEQTRLGALEGAKFDQAYTAAMIQDHTKDIREFEMAAKSSDPAVKEFAEKTLPTLREHLKMAQEAKTGAGTPSSAPRASTGASRSSK